MIDDPNPDLLRCVFHSWQLLPGRAHKRLRKHIKHRLNTAAVARMTRQRLRKADSNDEISGRLRAAAELAQHT